MARKTSLAVLVAAACLIPLSANAAGAKCVAGADENALMARVVQTELMVSALSCGETARYNSFVTSHQKVLMGAHTTLRGMFRRTYGGASATELNTFLTKLANDASSRSVQDIKSFCARTAVMYDALASSDPKQFASFTTTQDFAHQHGFRSCTQSASLTPAMVPVPKAKPATIWAPASADASPVLAPH